MESNITELRQKVEDQLFKWKSAKSSGTMVTQETERLKNIMLNNATDIVDALKVAEGAAKQIAELETELDSADTELKELDEEIKKLRKPAAKGKAKVVLDDESSIKAEQNVE